VTMGQDSADGSKAAGVAHLTQVFVVGTGRSGTKSLADLLSSIPGCRVRHELQPPLLSEAIAYLEDRLAHNEIVELLRRTRAPESVGGERLSGESNNRLSFVLPALAEAFPNARIVWLIRDGRDVVSSMQERRVYHPDEAKLRRERGREWAGTRIHADAVGDLPPGEWARLDPFGRSCWYWSYTNRLIARDLGRLGVRSLLVKLEHLVPSWPLMGDFLGLPPGLPTQIPHSNRSSRSPMRWTLWSSGQQALFRELCGSLMDEHYPGWDEEMRRGVGAEIYSGAARAAFRLRSSVANGTRPLRARLGLAGQVGRHPEADPRSMRPRARHPG
jgi:sulfotransferase family protein